MLPFLYFSGLFFNCLRATIPKIRAISHIKNPIPKKKNIVTNPIAPVINENRANLFIFLGSLFAELIVSNTLISFWFRMGSLKDISSLKLMEFSFWGIESTFLSKNFGLFFESSFFSISGLIEVILVSSSKVFWSWAFLLVESLNTICSLFWDKFCL